MVAAGTGVAILPASIRRVTHGAVKAVHLTAPAAVVTYVFAHRERPTSDELRRFLARLSR
jgi:DNA-binding transcriptional LysR family regulator